MWSPAAVNAGGSIFFPSRLQHAASFLNRILCTRNYFFFIEKTTFNDEISISFRNHIFFSEFTETTTFVIYSTRIFLNRQFFFQSTVLHLGKRFFSRKVEWRVKTVNYRLHNVVNSGFSKI